MNKANNYKSHAGPIKTFEPFLSISILFYPMYKDLQTILLPFMIKQHRPGRNIMLTISRWRTEPILITSFNLNCIILVNGLGALLLNINLKKNHKKIIDIVVCTRDIPRPFLYPSGILGRLSDRPSKTKNEQHLFNTVSSLLTGS